METRTLLHASRVCPYHGHCRRRTTRTWRSIGSSLSTVPCEGSVLRVCRSPPVLLSPLSTTAAPRTTGAEAIPRRLTPCLTSPRLTCNLQHRTAAPHRSRHTPLTMAHQELARHALWQVGLPQRFGRLVLDRCPRATHSTSIRIYTLPTMGMDVGDLLAPSMRKLFLCALTQA